MLNTGRKILITSSFTLLSTVAHAGYELKTTPDSSLTFGGYIKADARMVSGNVAATDYWYGGGSVVNPDNPTESATNFAISANETRFNAKYLHGDVTGFIEMDFYGEGVSGGGNEVISNSSKLRLRHAFINYKELMVGQNWTTFMNTSALPESADFAGPIVAAAFIRQGQIRYTTGNLQVSLENPETYGGMHGDDSIPDVIAKYTFNGDWGNVSVSGLARQLQTTNGESKSAFGYGVAGNIKTFGKDDIRFQLHNGNTGRYVGVTAVTDVVGEEVEESTSIMVAYRHFWNDDIRSTAYYGKTTTELSDRDRSHWAINLFKNYTKELALGVELGNFEMAEQNADSNYFQFSAKYVL